MLVLQTHVVRVGLGVGVEHLLFVLAVELDACGSGRVIARRIACDSAEKVGGGVASYRFLLEGVFNYGAVLVYRQVLEYGRCGICGGDVAVGLERCHVRGYAINCLVQVYLGRCADAVLVGCIGPILGYLDNAGLGRVPVGDGVAIRLGARNVNRVVGAIQLAIRDVGFLHRVGDCLGLIDRIFAFGCRVHTCVLRQVVPSLD